jgi:3-oxoacyl-[acyl-carrier-protein] synthase II
LVAPKVHVTGMGWVTPLGDTMDSVWRRLIAGETAFTAVPDRWRLRNELAALVPEVRFDCSAAERLHCITRRALDLTIKDRGFDAGEVGDLSLVIGTSLAGYLDGPEEDIPLLNLWAREVARAVGSNVEPIVVSTACSSGADAIAIGFELIRSGRVQRCVCGGADVVTSSKRIAHSMLGTMSPTRLRAFDIRHDGTLLGEGAAFLFLEAEATGRMLYGTVRGVGAANDAVGLTAPDPSGAGARKAIERSLSVGGLRPEQIGVVNAHGSGTPLNDATEAEAFRMVFDGSASPKFFATKGNLGHSLGATGAIEAIATILALNADEIPPIVELETPHPGIPFELVRGCSSRHHAAIGLSLTLGFGGFDTSLIFEAA